jgi:hypothetical protein
MDERMGWYADPAAHHDQRFWDGAMWTARVADGRAEATDPTYNDTWQAPGATARLTNRSILVVVVGVPLTTIVAVIWGAVFETSPASTDPITGWEGFLRNLPAVALWFVPPVYGLVTGVRACRRGAGRSGRAAIWVASVGLAWVLVASELGGLITAMGDPPGWAGFPLLVGKVGVAGLVLVWSLRAGRRGEHPVEIAAT